MRATFNNQHLNRGTTLAIALITALSISACGKKRDKDDEKSAAQAKVTVVPKAPAPAKAPVAPTASTAAERTAEGVLKVTAEDWKPIIKYDPLDAENVTKADVRKRLTGAEDERGLVFTDASTDYLITFLRLRADSVTDTVARQRNLKLAANISDVRMVKDEMGGITLKLRLKTETDRAERVATLTGQLNDSRIAELKSEAATLSTNEKVTAELRCVDLNQETCETSFLRITTGQPGSRGYAAIVLRETDAKLHVGLSMEPTYDENFKKLRSLFLNSMFPIEGDNLKTIKVSSWAVVNGRSAFSVRLISKSNEVIAFGGPLLASQTGATALNSLADRNLYVEDLIDAESLERRSTVLNDSIESVRVVNNNGLGQIKVKVKLPENLDKEKQEIDITVLRILKPILHISESSLYFQK